MTAKLTNLIASCGMILAMSGHSQNTSNPHSRIPIKNGLWEKTDQTPPPMRERMCIDDGGAAMSYFVGESGNFQCQVETITDVTTTKEHVFLDKCHGATHDLTLTFVSDKEVSGHGREFDSAGNGDKVAKDVAWKYISSDCGAILPRSPRLNWFTDEKWY